MRVIENKEKLTIDRLTIMKAKQEQKQKKEKDKKKKLDETHEDKVSNIRLLIGYRAASMNRNIRSTVQY